MCCFREIIIFCFNCSDILTRSYWGCFHAPAEFLFVVVFHVLGVWRNLSTPTFLQVLLLLLLLSLYHNWCGKIIFWQAAVTVQPQDKPTHTSHIHVHVRAWRDLLTLTLTETRLVHSEHFRSTVRSVWRTVRSEILTKLINWIRMRKQRTERKLF